MTIIFHVNNVEASYLNNFNDYIYARFIEEAHIDELLYDAKIIDVTKYPSSQLEGYEWTIEYDLSRTPIYYQLAEAYERLLIGL